MTETHPKFAVVGHPNKGKSSIVSTLAFDDSVQISDTPGTTTKKRSFPLTVDGRVLYELFDTPGFQRARSVLAWLQKHEVTADKRPDVVQAFINEHRDNERFNDEIELLEPIMAGAGIIYVVDGSKPYGEEYEAEMEILRWTGQPSMALINLIDETNYVEEWKRALGQYFKMVRLFNPMKATFPQHLSLLQSIAQLKEEWIEPVNESIGLFKAFHEQMFEQTARSITQLLYHSLSHVERLPIKEEDATEKEKTLVLERYKARLREYEELEQKRVEKVWHHENLEKAQQALLFDGMDLFSKESASLFGLSRKELLITGTTGGAMTGAGIDLLLGGSTLFLGSAIGAMVGGAGVFFGFNELSEVKVLGQKLGKRYLEAGPMKNVNFPYILLNRALFHATKIASRSHALRNKVLLEMGRDFTSKWMDDEVRKSLEKCHVLFRSGDEVKPETMKAYEETIGMILRRLID
ncbi:GTP-binding protein [Sulfurovum riftiae]|uniref:GTP-binding protein n=2 Tax=Sulfurovum riftiae TaxID=1630136 RepID=A0A151CDH1_9BACT|nr:GTP-binding protein [Sulfurovum riftiae]